MTGDRLSAKMTIDPQSKLVRLGFITLSSGSLLRGVPEQALEMLTSSHNIRSEPDSHNLRSCTSQSCDYKGTLRHCPGRWRLFISTRDQLRNVRRVLPSGISVLVSLHRMVHGNGSLRRTVIYARVRPYGTSTTRPVGNGARRVTLATRRLSGCRLSASYMTRAL